MLCRVPLRRLDLEHSNSQGVYDLLQFTQRSLPVKWEAARGFHVPQLHVHDCPDLPDMLEVRQVYLQAASGLSVVCTQG